MLAHYPGSGGRYVAHLDNDPTDPAQAAIFAWLERTVHIVDIPFVSRPKAREQQSQLPWR
mgnify:CR=1 FL=1